MTIEIENEVLYHYAVKKTGLFLEPACVKDRSELNLKDVLQGMTVNRGKVTCYVCRRMMGLVQPDFLFEGALAAFRGYTGET